MAERINQRTNPLIGKNIFRLRMQKKMRTSDVLSALASRGIAVRSGAFTKIENGANNPTVEMLIALTEILDCSFNDYFSDAF